MAQSHLASTWRDSLPTLDIVVRMVPELKQWRRNMVGHSAGWTKSKDVCKIRICTNWATKLFANVWKFCKRVEVVVQRACKRDIVALDVEDL